jgi:hypothetical protein
MNRAAFVEVCSQFVELRAKILSSRSPYVIGWDSRDLREFDYHFLIAEKHQEGLPEVRVGQTSFIGHQ